MSEPARSALIRFQEERLPPYDASHGTPHPMVQRSLEFTLPQGIARFEQTDYGHPGRLNPWEPRVIDAKLQPRSAELAAVAQALSALVGGAEA